MEQDDQLKPPPWRMPITEQAPQGQVSTNITNNPQEKPKKFPLRRLLTIFAMVIFIALFSLSGYYLYQTTGLKEQVATKYLPFAQEKTAVISKAVDKQQKSDYLETVVNSTAYARDAKRQANLLFIATAIEQYQAEMGKLPPNFPSSETCIGTSAECYDLASSLEPNYLTSIPTDPLSGTSENTGYSVYLSSQGRMVFKAQAEGKKPIGITR